tara:strand:+ start:4629 stop:6107 length:1479 start_codon:yes stop_codon:yes gene_type:complete
MLVPNDVNINIIMQSFRAFINEAIALHKAKDYKLSKTAEDKDGELLYMAYKDDVIEDVFNGKDRLIFPIEVDFDEDYGYVIDEEDNTFHEVINFLEVNGYYLDDVKDYINGHCYKIKSNGEPDLKNRTKIGKVLEKFDKLTKKIKKRNGDVITVKPVLYAFKNDSVRNLSEENMFVVISRHPYDVFGMSTDRHWSSCMKLGDGYSNGRALRQEALAGTLVAYLVKTDELRKGNKVALKRPTSRIAFRPLRNKQDELAYNIGPIYGAKSKAFTDFCTDWIAKSFNSLVEDDTGFMVVRGTYDRDPYTTPDIEELPNRQVKIRKMTAILNDHKIEAEKLLPSGSGPNGRSGPGDCVVWFSPPDNVDWGTLYAAPKKVVDDQRSAPDTEPPPLIFSAGYTLKLPMSTEDRDKLKAFPAKFDRESLPTTLKSLRALDQVLRDPKYSSYTNTLFEIETFGGYIAVSFGVNVDSWEFEQVHEFDHMLQGAIKLSKLLL